MSPNPSFFANIKQNKKKIKKVKYNSGDIVALRLIVKARACYKML